MNIRPPNANTSDTPLSIEVYSLNPGNSQVFHKSTLCFIKPSAFSSEMTPIASKPPTIGSAANSFATPITASKVCSVARTAPPTITSSIDSAVLAPHLSTFRIVDSGESEGSTSNSSGLSYRRSFLASSIDAAIRSASATSNSAVASPSGDSFLGSPSSSTTSACASSSSAASSTDSRPSVLVSTSSSTGRGPPSGVGFSSTGS